MRDFLLNAYEWIYFATVLAQTVWQSWVDTWFPGKGE